MRWLPPPTGGDAARRSRAAASGSPSGRYRLSAEEKVASEGDTQTRFVAVAQCPQVCAQIALEQTGDTMDAGKRRTPEADLIPVAQREITANGIAGRRKRDDAEHPEWSRRAGGDDDWTELVARALHKWERGDVDAVEDRGGHAKLTGVPSVSEYSSSCGSFR